MRFDVSNLMASIDCKRLRGADLISDEPLDLAGRERNAAPAESPQVGKAGMGAHLYTACLGDPEGMGHDLRIAPVKAAGDIGRGHNRKHRIVITAAIGTETFTKIRIKIDRKHELAFVVLDASTQRCLSTSRSWRPVPAIINVQNDPIDPKVAWRWATIALLIMLPVGAIDSS